MAGDYQFYKVERDGPVIIWKIYNPPKNFLTSETMAELFRLAEEFEKDPELRVAILTSALPDVFIQHHNVAQILMWSEALRAAPADSQPQPSNQRSAHRSLTQIPKPIIAAINGWASGGGCEVTLTCDFRFMSSKAVIGLPEINVGILPGGGGTQRMARLLGTARALELVMLGKIIDAREAYRIGLVNRVCEPDELMPAALEFARELATRPPLALAHVKRCIHEGSEITIDEGLTLESQLFFELVGSDDAHQLMSEYVATGQDRDWIIERFGTPEARQALQG